MGRKREGERPRVCEGGGDPGEGRRVLGGSLGAGREGERERRLCRIPVPFKKPQLRGAVAPPNNKLGIVVQGFLTGSCLLADSRRMRGSSDVMCGPLQQPSHECRMG